MAETMTNNIPKLTSPGPTKANNAVAEIQPIEEISKNLREKLSELHVI